MTSNEVIKYTSCFMGGGGGMLRDICRVLIDILLISCELEFIFDSFGTTEVLFSIYVQSFSNQLFVEMITNIFYMRTIFQVFLVWYKVSTMFISIIVLNYAYLKKKSRVCEKFCMSKIIGQ